PLLFFFTAPVSTPLYPLSLHDALPISFQLALGSLAAVPRITESFRTGAGMGWHEHDDDVFHGCEKFFRPSYAANLISSWIPSLQDRKSTRLNSSHLGISYAVFCLKKKK